jgi:hypothetical protein
MGVLHPAKALSLSRGGGILVMFSTSRVMTAGFMALAIAAIVFAAWPHQNHATNSASKISPALNVPASSGSSTFGGKMAESRPDIRARSLYVAPAGGN